MRLDEIINSNQIIINLKNMRVEFTDEFNFINSTHLFLINNKMGTNRHHRLSGNIENLQSDMIPFLDYDFDPDTDIDQLKLTARNIFARLEEIKKQFP